MESKKWKAQAKKINQLGNKTKRNSDKKRNNDKQTNTQTDTQMDTHIRRQTKKNNGKLK